MISHFVDVRAVRRIPISPLTRHAQRRMKDRSIPQSIIDALLDFGERRPAGDGSEAYYFSKRAWRRFATYLGTEARHFEKYRDVYAVVANDDHVVTVC